MKTSTRLTVLLLTASAAVFGLGGCNSFESRAKEKSEVFNSLPSRTQQRLEHGNIKVGDTPDMVYIALGDPDEKRDVDSAAGQQTSWIYRTYWQQYEGTTWVGWHRMIVPAANGRGYVVFHEPIERDLYTTRVDEVIRVTFADGKVTTVDQRKR